MASVGIKVVRSTSNLCDMTNSYKNNSTPRGYCLIINNEKFKDPEKFPTREGSQKDVETLRQLFTDLGYTMWDTVEEAKTSNLTAEEIKDVVKKFAASDKQNSVDSSIVAILSHGGAEDVIFGADDEKLSFSDDILRLFEGENAPGLMQKPKLFILQACRGGMTYIGMHAESLAHVHAILPISVRIKGLNGGMWLEAMISRKRLRESRLKTQQN
ncbi:PREDICTED: cell death protein 3-like [Priapulus caudatus]|uniref:Cell death protein 3-like n=1 Tax=Priapulus caudatus TaxID=37621 RepID=A0ABM1EN19_PRICU|nr:PREDICTED: cell death protein 3-like [Priapulus caudatus]